MSGQDATRLSVDAPTHLGETGYQLTRIGLGTWAIGGPWQRGWGEQDDGASVETILHAVERGINWIDTAAVYGLGHAESLLGDALAGLEPQRRPLVFTKVGRYEGRGFDGKLGDPETVRRGCEESLDRLRADSLDLFQLHYPPADGTPLEVTWETMAALKEEGKTAYLGACNCTLSELDAIDAIAPVDVLQPALSMIKRGALGDVIPWARERGRGVIVYSPMQSGILTGSLHERIRSLAADDWRRGDREFLEPRLSRNLDLVERLRPIAEDLGVSISELAIAWATSQEGVTAAIAGARRPDQIDGWIGAAAVELDSSTLAEVDSAIAASGAGEGPLDDQVGD